MRRRLGFLGSVLAGLLIAAPAAQARDAIVESFDGTPIVTHLYPASGLEAGERAPTIMIGPGWGGSGETNPNGGSVGPFVDAGYNVLTWDPRGFGGSGGTVMIDHPEFEGRDAQALIDFIAGQPESQLDGPGDPRLGMSGGSYGGGIQFVLAAIDDRVDVIAPTIAWNSLVSSLFKSRSVKVGWGAALAGVGVPLSLLPGIFSPAGVQAGHQSEQFYSTVVEGLATGTVGDANRRWFAEHGPSFLLDDIDVPTLILQGTVDTLFPPSEAHANYERLKDNGVPLKMMWYCGGHGACLTESDGSTVIGDSRRAQRRRLQWFERYLKGNAGQRTGPAFEWIDEAGTWRTSEGYPLREVGAITGAGAGPLPLVPAVSTIGSGILLFATPAPIAVEVPLPGPQEPANVVGAPRLKLTYSGIAAPQRTFLYAQLVDRSRNVVVNNQATPIPIKLDGQRRTLKLPLEQVASRTTGAGYELQITGGTSLYDIQRSAGLVDVKRAVVRLPLTAPVR